MISTNIPHNNRLLITATCNLAINGQSKYIYNVYHLIKLHFVTQYYQMKLKAKLLQWLFFHHWISNVMSIKTFYKCNIYTFISLDWGKYEDVFTIKVIFPEGIARGGNMTFRGWTHLHISPSYGGLTVQKDHL